MTELGNNVELASDDSSESEDSEAEQDIRPTATRSISPTNKMNLPSIMDGRYFEVTKFVDEKKVLARCRMCPNKLLSAQIDATSNLLKHLKV